MGIQDKITRTIQCDAAGCENKVVFDPQNGDDVTRLPDWLKGVRQTVRGDKAQFTYCSDVCEVKGVTTGNHNLPEPKKIATATEADVKQAAANDAAAKAMAQTDKGTEAAAAATIKLTDGE